MTHAVPRGFLCLLRYLNARNDEEHIVSHKLKPMSPALESSSIPPVVGGVLIPLSDVHSKELLGGKYEVAGKDTKPGPVPTNR